MGGYPPSLLGMPRAGHLSGCTYISSTTIVALHPQLCSLLSQPFEVLFELLHYEFFEYHTWKDVSSCCWNELIKLASLPLCGFIAQSVERRTGIAKVTGSNPVEALIFSGFFFLIA